ncbi:MAG TPA: erythromycin esterase family protein, partial [Archangium sp.]
GLDVFGLQASASEALRTLECISPELAEAVRAQLPSLTPWPRLGDAPPALAVDTEAVVVRRLTECLLTRLELARHEGDKYQECLDRTRIAAEADRVYRAMFGAPLEAWNLRQKHLFETLEALLAAGGSKSKAIVWGHDATVGDSAATSLGEKGAVSLGHLCRQQWREKAYTVGFGTDHGSVLAARAWDQAPLAARVRPAPEGTLGGMLRTSGVPAFTLPLRTMASPPLRDWLLSPRPQRSFGAILGDEEPLVTASLVGQFDEYVWFEESKAANALGPQPPVEAIPDTWPFGS